MSEFDDCLKKRALVRFEGSPDVVAREIKATHEDLNDAGLMVAHQQWKRLTITAYYCMFHAARALVLSAGYAEKSHFCLGVAFRELYANTPVNDDVKLTPLRRFEIDPLSRLAS